MSANALAVLYGDITDHLLTVTELKWVDIDMGQLDKEGASYPMEYPAALIRFDNIIWKDIIPERQLGLVHFTIKIAYQFNTQDNFAQPRGANNDAQELFIIIDKIDLVLRSVRGSIYSIVKRFNDSLLATKPDEQLWVYVMEFQANIQSDSGNLEKPELVDVDFVDLANNNLVLERKRLNVRRVGY